MRMRCRLVLALLPAPLLLALLSLALLPPAAPARAGEFAQVPPTPGMALTLPEPGMANSASVGASVTPSIPVAPQIDPGEGRRRLHALGTGFPSIGDQRTGSRHQHAVHDICIGC